MKNNIWEEQGNPQDITDFHEKLLSKMEIPEWMKLNCPFCGKPLPLRSIRSFGVKFNTRNLGDIVVEVLCDKCAIMDTLYFRKEVSCISEFIEFLAGKKQPKSKPILEEDMFRQQYNNVMEDMCKNDLA